MISKFLLIISNRFISYLFGYLSDIQKPKFLIKKAIQYFISYYKVDTSVLINDLADFNSFSDFFSRPINLKYRPFNKEKKNDFISPCDGYIINSGYIKEDLIFHIKNQNYYIKDLVFQEKYQKLFYNGIYIHIYLRPKDYHRIHVPMDGYLKSIEYFSGKKYPVNKKWSLKIPENLKINERLNHYFQVDSKTYFSIIKIGALNVGKIESKYFNYDVKKNIYINEIKNLKESKYIEKGKEIAQFKLGSTIILLMSNNYCLKKPTSLREILLGQKIAFKKENFY